MKTIKLFILLLAAVPMMMTGCKKAASNGQASNVKFNITDAPANFDALNINIQGIKVHSQSAGWITFNSQLGTINILNYVNGSSTMVAQGDINAGTIDQVQLVLGSGNNVVVNGTTYPLSSTQLSGLTVNMNGQLQAGGQYNWTFDFDASQSVSAAGSGSFSFNPTVRLIVDSLSINAGGSASGSGGGSGGVNVGTGGSGTGTVVVNGGTNGSITGTISPAQLASVCITGSNGNSLCTMTSVTGQFSLQAVGSGNYSVTITPVLPLVSAHTINNVTVTAGQTTNIGIVSM